MHITYVGPPERVVPACARLVMAMPPRYSGGRNYEHVLEMPC